jgi:N-acetylmuramoyl-L-alanine amidase
MRIGIDPGHGGRDPGAVGGAGVKEKDITLAISLELNRLLKAKGLDIFMTRVDDSYLELVTRSASLNNTKCDLAISVHINSATRREANYISTFIQGAGGQAEKLAEKVQAELVQTTGWPDGGVRVKNLHMTRETKMPAILCECGFISNPEQERQLRQPEMQKKIAGAIADGILVYLGIKGEDGVQDVKVLVKGKELPGKLIDGQTYVPIRTIVEALNNQVIWDEKNQIVIVK